jgi:hypothetical protein
MFPGRVLPAGVALVATTATATASAATTTATAIIVATATLAAAVATTASSATTTAFTAAVAATTSATATTACTGLTRLGRIHAQRATSQVGTIHRLRGFGDLRGICQGHEGKASWSAGLAVSDQFHTLNGSEGGECFCYFFFSSTVGQIAHIDVHYSISLAKRRAR